MTKSKNDLDLLAFGAHPDDVEIGMGGTIAKYALQGYKVGICTLTKAELSSNGTIDSRQAEANKAAELLHISNRVQLDFPDRGLTGDASQIGEIVDIIRTYKPTLIFAPYEIDRHPDHGRCSSIVKEAVFSAAIKKYHYKASLPPHRVNAIHYYMINGFHKPDFIIDISDYIKIKLSAIASYESQFIKREGSVATPLTNGYIETVESRERLFGKEVGVDYGEGFISEKPMIIHHLLGEKR